MRFRLTMKSPDALETVVEDYVGDYMGRARDAAEEAGHSLSEDDLEEIGHERAREMRAAANPWLKWGELLTVEFDTADGSCRVVKP